MAAAVKASYEIPISIERLFDQPRHRVVIDGITIFQGWPFWLAKEWFARGHGEGKRGPVAKLP